MSYQLYFHQMNESEEHLFYDSRSDSSSLLIDKPQLTLELNKAGQLEFSIYPNHVYFDSFHRLSTYVRVVYNSEEIFRGRVLSIQTGIYLERQITCEGDLAYLVDSIQQPDRYVVRSDQSRDIIVDNSEEIQSLPEDIRDQMEEEEMVIARPNLSQEHASFESVYAHFVRYITKHNQQVDENRRFRIGRVTVDDPDISREFSSSSWRTTKDGLDSDLTKYYGGYFQTRSASDGYPYIDYLVEPEDVIGQPITLGVNMVDLDETISGEDIFTVFIPIGKDNLTIASVNDGNIGIEIEEGVTKFGKIYKTETYNNVSDPEILKIYGLAYIEANYKHSPASFEVKAIDMNLIDASIDRIRVGSIVNVVSGPHNLNGMFVCTKIEYDIQNPENNNYEIGDPSETLSHKNNLDKLGMNENIDAAAARSSYAAGLGYDAHRSQDREAENLRDVVKKVYTLTAGTIKMNADLIDVEADAVDIRTDMLSIKSQTGVPGRVAVFNVSKAYNPGDYVMMDNVLYRFKASHPAGTAWTLSHVYAVPDLSSEINQNSKEISFVTKQSGVVGEVRDFSETWAFRSGNYVYYPDSETGRLYRFTADHTGPWTGQDVVVIETHEARIAQNYNRIVAEVTRATAAETDLSGRLEVEAGKVGMIVEETAGGNRIRGASVIAAINADTGESAVTIDADKIDLQGYVTVDDLSSGTIEAIDVGAGEISAHDVIGTIVEGEHVYVGEHSYQSYQDAANAIHNVRIVSVTGTNNYKLQYLKMGYSGTSDSDWVDAGTFSRAIAPLISGSWSNGVYNIASNPSAQSGSKLTVTPDIRLSGTNADNFSAEMLDDSSNPTVQKSVYGYLGVTGSGSSQAVHVYKDSAKTQSIAQIAAPSSGSSSVNSIELTDVLDWYESTDPLPSGLTNLGRLSSMVNSHKNGRGTIVFSARLSGVSGQKLYSISIGSA